MRDSSTFLVAEMLFGAINADAGMLFSLVPLKIMIRFQCNDVRACCVGRGERTLVFDMGRITPAP